MDEHGSVVLLTDRLTASHIASSAEWIENEMNKAHTNAANLVTSIYGKAGRLAT